MRRNRRLITHILVSVARALRHGKDPKVAPEYWISKINQAWLFAIMCTATHFQMVTAESARPVKMRAHSA
jgi:hypothetical protein